LRDPQDRLANLAIDTITKFPSSLKLFIAVYLIVHGAIKIGLLSSLWLQERKVYPIAILIFALFVIYQIYEYILSPSIVLIVLTLLDALVIILTYIEYKHLKKFGSFEI